MRHKTARLEAAKQRAHARVFQPMGREEALANLVCRRRPGRPQKVEDRLLDRGLLSESSTPPQPFTLKRVDLTQAPREK